MRLEQLNHMTELTLDALRDVELYADVPGRSGLPLAPTANPRAARSGR